MPSRYGKANSSRISNNVFSINFWNSAGAFFNLNGALTHLHRPHGVKRQSKGSFLHQDKLFDKLSVDQGIRSTFFLLDYQSHLGYMRGDGGQLVFLNFGTGNRSTI